MKTRKTIIISLSIALIVLIATISLQAQSTSISNLKWEGVDSDDGKWELSWDTTIGENYAWLRYRDCGVTSVFLLISSNLEFSREGNKTHLKFPPVINNTSGQTCEFRVTVRSCVTVTVWSDEVGYTTEERCNYPSAREEVTFPN